MRDHTRVDADACISGAVEEPPSPVFGTIGSASFDENPVAIQLLAGLHPVSRVGNEIRVAVGYDRLPG